MVVIHRGLMSASGCCRLLPNCLLLFIQIFCWVLLRTYTHTRSSDIPSALSPRRPDEPYSNLKSKTKTRLSSDALAYLWPYTPHREISSPRPGQVDLLTLWLELDCYRSATCSHIMKLLALCKRVSIPQCDTAAIQAFGFSRTLGAGWARALSHMPFKPHQSTDSLAQHCFLSFVLSQSGSVSGKPRLGHSSLCAIRTCCLSGAPSDKPPVLSL